jgi:hypothetical protein
MMEAFIRSGATAVIGVFALVGTFGTGTAFAAPPFYGQTYAEASEHIQNSGYDASIATVFGSQLPTPDCIVMNAYRSITLNSSGTKAHHAWMLELNCNRLVAQPGKPGNSAVTPEGQKAKKYDGWVAIWNKHPEKCDNSGTFCEGICARYGGCSAELLDYLAKLS